MAVLIVSLVLCCLYCMLVVHQIMSSTNLSFPIIPSVVATAESTTPKPECVVDGECSDALACIQQRCQDPCIVYDNCAPNAECHVIRHRAVCSCPDGFRGNANIQCFVGKSSHVFYTLHMI